MNNMKTFIHPAKALILAVIMTCVMAVIQKQCHTGFRLTDKAKTWSKIQSFSLRTNLNNGKITLSHDYNNTHVDIIPFVIKPEFHL